MMRQIMPRVHWPNGILFIVYTVSAFLRPHDLESHGPGLVGDKAAVARRFEPVIAVTISFVFLLMTFLFRQSATAFGLRFQSVKKDDDPVSMPSIKYGTGGGRPMLAANRVVGNMLEQAPCFLLALWLHAAFVDCSGAATLGWVWIAFRCLYPFVWGRIPWIFCSTLPGYGVIGALLWPLVRFT